MAYARQALRSARDTVIPLWGLNQQGMSATVTSQRHLNLFANIEQEAEKSRVSFYGTPGLDLFSSVNGDTPVRGWIQTGDLFYYVHRGTFYSMDNSGTRSTIGTLTTTQGKVGMAFNGLVIVIVDGTHGYGYDIARAGFFRIYRVSTGTTTSTTANKLVNSTAAFNTDGTAVGMTAYNTTDGTQAIITAIDSATTLSVSADNFASGKSYAIGPDGFPDGATTATWLGGQFVVDAGPSSDQFNTSPDGSAWDALDFAHAESNPDGLVRVFADNGEIILGGSATTEYWGNAGNADFSFSAIKGATVEVGLAARWSMCKFNSGVAFLGTPASAGKFQVYFVQGYVPRPISTPEIDAIINGYSTVSDAVAFSYTSVNGHPMYQISFPTANATWLFDAATGLWSPMESGLDGDRRREELQLNFLTRILVSDYENGNIYVLNPSTYTDNGTSIPREIIGRHIFHANDRVIVDELYVDMETGVGIATGQGSDPQAILQISRDNGHTWGTELWTTMGKIGKYLTRVVWRRLGLARDFTFKVRVTDPVKVVFTFGAIRLRG